MTRRTISHLSRELRVSRNKIYRTLEQLGFEKKAGAEFPLDEWEKLKAALLSAADISEQKRSGAKKVKKSAKAAAEIIADKEPSPLLGDVTNSTLWERLGKAKQEFDFNRRLIESFQAETEAYLEKYGTTTVLSHNGAMTAIPAIGNHEKYVKLNIALSKLISDLESDLDLSAEGGEDVFG